MHIIHMKYQIYWSILVRLLPRFMGKRICLNVHNPLSDKEL
jgi:hypothetical protein